MNSSKIKLRHFIATHTFHSAGAMKEFRSAFKKRKKKNSDWFNTETPEVKDFFQYTKRQTTCYRKRKKRFQPFRFYNPVSIFLGKGDFFFCHWYSIDEQAIIDRLAAAGGDKFFITMATVIDAPKINVEVMQSYLQKLK